MNNTGRHLAIAVFVVTCLAGVWQAWLGQAPTPIETARAFAGLTPVLLALIAGEPLGEAAREWMATKAAPQRPTLDTMRLTMSGP